MKTASWYHCSVKPISRSTGRSAVAATAYRIGKKLYDERTQKTHDYTRRTGVESYFTVAPINAPDWVIAPQLLWNTAEATEKRCNSQTAREIELALPNGVSKEEREQIARDFATHLVERYQVAVMAALHEPSKKGDERNHHAHILMTTRRIDEKGFGNKTRELDDLKTGKLEVLHIREYAADLINAALENAGSDERIDHRSYKDRGIEQVPTEHLSLTAIKMERKGQKSEQGNRNRAAKQTNENIAVLLEERAELDRQIETEQAKHQVEIVRLQVLAEGKRAEQSAPDQAPEPSQEQAEAKETNPAPPEPPKLPEATEKPPEHEEQPAPSTNNLKPTKNWQGKITAEREENKEGDNEGGTPPAKISEETEQRLREQKEKQSAFNNPINRAYNAQITTQGEIQHKGLDRHWTEHAAQFMQDLGQEIRTIAHNVLTAIKTKWQDLTRDKGDHDIER